MYIDKPIVGIERRMEAVLSSIEMGIDEVRMIGISGIGGGGKTTLAIAVFNKISTRFEGISFVENIREVSKMSGLQSLQKQVILDVSNGKDMVIHSVDHGKNMIMNILQGKKVLIVLDDVDHNDQLVALISEPSWYKVGSRIIITARNKQVLEPYVVMPIHEGSHKEEAIRILEICGLRDRIGFRNRELRSLIRFSSDQHLDMHDHIQGMGKYIDQRKYPDDPKKHSRLWEREKIKEILDNEWVSKETKAIALDECLTSDIVAK
nr:TMV resistance protein N-like [Tanacetum cinerariifolium]